LPVLSSRSGWFTWNRCTLASNCRVAAMLRFLADDEDGHNLRMESQ
jgi:hypothetical protein